MEFEFNSLKATQAAAVLLKQHGGRDHNNYTKLLKLLYIADRVSLATIGQPITGSRFANLPHGPVPDDVYACVKGYDLFDGTWGQYIRKDGFDVVLEKDPGDGELSDYEVETLETLYAKFKGEGYSRMIDLVHTLPEWVDPEGSSTPLPAEDVLRGAKVDVDTIDAFRTRNEHVLAVRKMLTE